MTTIISVMGNKGGTAKSTLVRNLADGCARAGLRTIVVDADPQHTLTITMQIQPVDALLALLDTGQQVEWSDVLCEVPEAFSGSPREFFYLLPTFEGLANIEHQAGLPERIYERFQELTGYADIVLVDTSPGRSNIHAGFYQVSQGVLLPCQCELESILGLGATLNHLYTIGQTAPVGEVIGIIPTLFDASITTHQVNYGFLLEQYKRYPIFKPLREMSIWKDAAQNRQSIYQMSESKHYYQRQKAKVAVAELQPVLDAILKMVNT